MKVLYFPLITREDYDRLISKFSEEYSSYTTRSRFSYIVAIGATLSSWALAYRYRFKFGSFVALTVGTFALTQCSMGCYYNSLMRNNCNLFARRIASSYPSVKYLKVDYTESDKLNKKI